MADAEGQAPDQRWLKYANGRLLGMRTTRYSFWVHWRQLADYFLPRRYKWLIQPNEAGRGAPLNDKIIDSTGTLAARNLTSGLLSGKCSPLRPWFNLSIGHFDNVGTNPVSLWIAQCEGIMRRIFHESNFYTSIAQFFQDLVIFGTAVMMMEDDYENVVNCINPCAGEYYVDLNDKYEPVILGREFVLTVQQIVDRFKRENCPSSILTLYDDKTGANLTREFIIAHLIEPTSDGRDFGLPEMFKFRECYWVFGGVGQPQSGSQGQVTGPAFLQTGGYMEAPHIITRWDITANDPYGRSVAMDALGDQKQLQLESRRKAQAIDKMVNPPLVADIQLKNQPANMLPGGMTYVTGMATHGKPGIASVYDTKFPIAEITEDLNEVRERIKITFFNHLFQPISQFETRSNVTAVEIDQRRAEGMLMLGPVFERLDHEGLKQIIERVWGQAVRARILPPPPAEIANLEMTINFQSMLATAQEAAQAGSIERVLTLATQLGGVIPETLDKLNTDQALDIYSAKLQNDPRIIRSDEEVAAIRQQRQKVNQQAHEAAVAKDLAAGAKNLSGAQVTPDVNALQMLAGGP